MININIIFILVIIIIGSYYGYNILKETNLEENQYSEDIQYSESNNNKICILK